MLVRAIVAFAALPGIVAFALPLLIGLWRSEDAGFRWGALALLLPGTALLLACAREFYVAGKGTLAPWSPPRHLVVSGPYRVSRNPMYLAVMLIVWGWALGFGSAVLSWYALAVTVAVIVRVMANEEPRLRAAFREEWPRYAQRTPRFLFRSRRAVVWTWVALLLALPLAGLVYEAYADGTGAVEFTPPGMLVDIGGRRLHLLCIGDGERTVIFESSGFGNALSSERARERLAGSMTVCSYDRAGRGWSDPAPGVETAGTTARDLGVLQDRAQLRGPYVLVASSIGGLTAEMFARQYPERVSGLVLLDAANSLLVPALVEHGGSLTTATCTANALSYFGVLRLLDPFAIGEDETEGARRDAWLSYNSRAWGHTCAMARSIAETQREFAAAPPLDPNLSLTVLTASSSDALVPPRLEGLIDVERWRQELPATQKQFAALLKRGKWAVVPDSTHLIGNSQPDAVADAVVEMVETIGR